MKKIFFKIFVLFLVFLFSVFVVLKLNKINEYKILQVIEADEFYIDFNNIKNEKYKNLLIQQNSYIQINSDRIRKNADKLYKFVTVDKQDFFLNICCDFKKLEEKCREYEKKNRSN